MKKKHLSIEQVTANLQTQFPNTRALCTDAKQGEISGLMAYKINADTGESIVTSKQVYLRFFASPVEDIRDHDSVYEFDGESYIKMPDKEQAIQLQIICGFKKRKSEITVKRTLKERVEASIYFFNNKENWNANDIVRRYKTLQSYVESLFEQFSTVKIHHTETELTFKYYTGFGKTFREGRGKIAIDELDLEILVPELLSVAKKYNSNLVQG